MRADGQRCGIMAGADRWEKELKDWDEIWYARAAEKIRPCPQFLKKLELAMTIESGEVEVVPEGMITGCRALQLTSGTEVEAGRLIFYDGRMWKTAGLANSSSREHDALLATHYFHVGGIPITVDGAALAYEGLAELVKDSEVPGSGHRPTVERVKRAGLGCMINSTLSPDGCQLHTPNVKMVSVPVDRDGIWFALALEVLKKMKGPVEFLYSYPYGDEARGLLHQHHALMRGQEFIPCHACEWAVNTVHPKIGNVSVRGQLGRIFCHRCGYCKPGGWFKEGFPPEVSQMRQQTHLYGLHIRQLTTYPLHLQVWP